MRLNTLYLMGTPAVAAVPYRQQRNRCKQIAKPPLAPSKP